MVMPKTGYMWDDWATPPIGIAYVSAYLKANGVNTVTVNMNLEDDDVYTVLEKYIREYKIDALGTAELVVNCSKLQEICRCARKIKPDIMIWVGGGLPTNSPYETMQLIPEADFGMIGEGEISSLELIRAWENGTDIDKINVPGLMVRKRNGEIYQTPLRTPIANLDELPFPDWEGFRLVETCKKYRKDKEGVVTSIVSSRSCPNACTFCSKSLKISRYRRRSLDSIFAEIDNLVNKYHVTQLNFNDELFADKSDRLYQFCDRMEKYNIKYRICMHVGKNLTYPLLKRMYESGCRVIFYGLESADNDILKSMRKFTKIEEIERCLRVTKQAGITAEGNFIFGDPKETTKTVNKTLDWIRNHFTLGVFEAAPIKLYPGSQLYEDAVASGKIKDTVKFVEDEIPLVNVSALTDDEYRNLVNHDLTIIQKMKTIKQDGLSLYVKNGKVTAKYVCENCGEENYIDISDSSTFMRMFTAHCKKCNALEYLNLLPFYYEKIQEHLQDVLKNHTVAIFGCGSVWKTFFEMSDIFSGDNYFLTDETPYLQKEGWNGRRVYSPGELKKLNVDYVIGMIRISRLETEEKLYGKYKLPKMTVRMCYELIE